jgi:hypothetical protein
MFQATKYVLSLLGLKRVAIIKTGNDFTINIIGVDYITFKCRTIKVNVSD